MRTPNVGRIILFRFSKGSIKINQLNRVKIKKIITNNIQVLLFIYMETCLQTFPKTNKPYQP